MNLLPRPRFVELTERLVHHDSIMEQVDGTLPAQGYALTIHESGVRLLGGDSAGLYYGHATLRQLLSVNGGKLPIGTIRDYPDILNRAVMIDISRDKVPKLSTLYDLIARLASWKINQLQLYTEHTFTYRNHPLVHQYASGLTADDIRALDEFCAKHFIELVPNQNCLGHMDRWLNHDLYRDLALEPNGFFDSSGFGIWRPPMTIDPANPRSSQLIRELLGELLPLFNSHRIHVGLDEAMELGYDRIDDFLEWVHRLRNFPELEGREMLIWGDMFSDKPDLLRHLPKGVTVCEWGYESSHPFNSRCAELAAAGIPFWVVSGTSSWLTILGRVRNARANCVNAAEAAIEHGAEGFMIADWGDQGHLQQLPISDPGLAYGAAVSWCLDSNRELDLASALSAHAYDDSSGQLADALLLLGDAYLAITAQVSNASSIVLHLYYPQLTVGQGHTHGLNADELNGLMDVLTDARVRLGKAAPRRADGMVLIQELLWSIGIVTLLVADAKARLAGDGSLASVPAVVRRGFAVQLAGLIEHHRELWLGRNRPGGREDSVSWLNNLRSAYETGKPDPDWAGYRVS